MDKELVLESLSIHGIRKTPFRIELLALFMKSKHSLSHKDIKQKITSTQDKVTIYRALETFLEKGLIHKVPGSNHISKYALCLPECSGKSHCQNHTHFICHKCDQTFCVHEIEIPMIKDTKGFRVKSLKLTLEGECPDCITDSNE